MLISTMLSHPPLDTTNVRALLTIYGFARRSPFVAWVRKAVMDFTM
jgi:hypothetical protein